jgi:non-homologous end joining protein Ku
MDTKSETPSPILKTYPQMKLPAEMVELAEHILETKAGHFDPASVAAPGSASMVYLSRAFGGGEPLLECGGIGN